MAFFLGEQTISSHVRSVSNVLVRSMRRRLGIVGLYARMTSIVMGIGLVFVACWWYLCFCLFIPNPLRFVLVWSFVVGLAVVAVVVNPEGRC